MNQKELLELNLKKNWRGYEAFMLLIATLEGMMMVYGYVKFDFHDLRRILYYSAYVFLFCCTIMAIIVNRIGMKNRKESLIINNAYFYSTGLILWSAWISALDIVRGGYPVTFMTILAAVGSLVPLYPMLYACIAFVASGGIVMIVLCVGNTTLHVPFFLNHAIFLLVAILVEIRNYHLTREQYMLNKRLEELAGIDELTQISNRRSLDRYMGQLLQEGKAFTFVLLDVDNFKSINDTYGHQEGDVSLVSIADILTEMFGETVFRYGGDEFAVVSFEDAKSVAEKMEQINHRLKERNTEYVLQTCAGVYRSEGQYDERKIFELADAALYDAKQHGKARAVIYGANAPY